MFAYYTQELSMNVFIETIKTKLSAEFKCSNEEKRCGSIEQCVADEFFCDYEMVS